MANNRRQNDDDVYRQRRYGRDPDYERDFWRNRDERQAHRYYEDVGEYSSLPVLGTAYGGGHHDDLQYWRGGEEGEPSRYGRPFRGRYREHGPTAPERYEPPAAPRGGYGRGPYEGSWRQRGVQGARADRRPWQGEPGLQGERGLWDRTKDEIRSWMGDVQAEWRRQADHRGRGPRGYVRSDERIREDVSDRLMEDRYIDATDIEVSVSGGEVRLSGSVDAREIKRRAEDIAADVLGVKDVQNTLRVRPAPSAGESTSSQPATSAPVAETRPSSTPRH